MKNMAAFFKTTVLGGLFVLLPLLLLYLMLSEIVSLIIALASPIIGLLPAEAFDEPSERTFLAIVIIFVISFLIGLFSRSESGRHFGQWLERSTLNRLPAYGVLKKLTQGFSKSSGNTFKPALFESLTGVQDLVYVVEDYGTDKVAILRPSAPAAFSGPIKIVKRDRVELLDVDLAEFTQVLGHWGVGTNEIKIKKTSASTEKI